MTHIDVLDHQAVHREVMLVGIAYTSAVDVKICVDCQSDHITGVSQRNNMESCHWRWILNVLGCFIWISFHTIRSDDSGE